MTAHEKATTPLSVSLKQLHLTIELMECDLAELTAMHANYTASLGFTTLTMNLKSAMSNLTDMIALAKAVR